MTQESTPTLEPCPFCGEVDCEAIDDPRQQWVPWFVVLCRSDGCHTLGPAARTMPEAIAAWNTRTPPASQSDDLLDEIAEAISDTLDMDWQPSWAAPNILALINRERAAARREGIEEAVIVAEDFDVTGMEAYQARNDIADAIRALAEKQP